MIRSQVLVVGSIAVAVASVGCKKNIEPAAFDAGVSATPVVATAAPTVEAVPSAPEPLASLAPATTPPPVAAGAAKPKANKNLPECETARRFCNHPAHGSDKAIQDLCTKNKQGCFAKGGVL